MKLSALFNRIHKSFGMKMQTIMFAIVLFVLIFIDAYRTPSTNTDHISYNIIALIFGLVLESTRLMEKWIDVLLKLVICLVISFIFTVHNDYNFDRHLQIWPYSFIAIYALVSIFIHEKNLISHITIGDMIIQLPAFIYWILSRAENCLYYSQLTSLCLLPISLLIYAIYAIYRRDELNPSARLTMSISSCIILTILSIDNSIAVFMFPEIEHITISKDHISILMAYFFLGISTMYIVYNFILLMKYYPDKNMKYSKQKRLANISHLKRFSKFNVNFKYAMMVLLVSTIIYSINYHYKIIHCNMAIWSVFVLTPHIIRISYYLRTPILSHVDNK